MVRTMAAGIQQSPAVPATFWIEAERMAALERGAVDTTPAKKEQPLAHASDTSAPRGAMHVDLEHAVDELTAPPPSDNIASRLSSVIRANWSELFRSWFVMLFFALGAGLAPHFERLLRPIDYPNSETYRSDIELTIFMVLLLVLACVVARFATHAPPQPHAQETRER